MSLDAAACREALDMSGKILMRALLPDGDMTDEEALAAIGGVVRTARSQAIVGRGEAPCGDVLRQLDHLTRDAQFHQLDDDEVRELFNRVIYELETADAAVFA